MHVLPTRNTAHLGNGRRNSFGTAVRWPCISFAMCFVETHVVTSSDRELLGAAHCSFRCRSILRRPDLAFKEPTNRNGTGTAVHLPWRLHMMRIASWSDGKNMKLGSEKGKVWRWNTKSGNILGHRFSTIGTLRTLT